MKKRRLAVALVLGMILGLVGGGKIGSDLSRNATHSADEEVIASIKPPAAQVPQELVDAGAAIGLSYAQLQSVHAQIGSFPDLCDPSKADACYYKDQIYIYPSVFTNGNLKVALAYEWFHHYWSTKSPTEQLALHPDLDALYNVLSTRRDAQHELAFILDEQPKGSYVFYDEMQSVACTKTYHIVDSNLDSYCKSAGLNLGSIQAEYSN